MGNVFQLRPGKKAVVLVSVIAIVCENEVWGDALELFEDRLHFHTRERHESVLKTLQQWALECSRPGKQDSATLRLLGSHARGAEHRPMEHTVGILADQAQDRPATTDFDVIGVCAQTQDFDWGGGVPGEAQGMHGVSLDTTALERVGLVRLAFHTSHGAVPPRHKFSSCCLSWNLP